jgi:ketosteroid isomerase-like protein/catechol 2,3-dioxygenase-like lactoylglutathione lyase family enzyme
MNDTADELIRLEEDWGRAMVTNDAEAIGRYMADDWTIVGPDGTTSDKVAFLELVKSGVLSHDVMEADDIQVRVYGDSAVLTMRAVSGGKYRGQPFQSVERVSDVWIRQAGSWRCVLTHLSRLAGEPTGRRHFVNAQPLICVHDVEASSRWYQRLLGCQSAHGGAEYERLVRNEALILQLHSFATAHHHGPIGDPDDKPYGNGVLLWFELDDFDEAIARAAAMNAEILMPTHRNPPSGDGGPNHWECWLRDPDGYTVVLASPDGSAG